MSYVSARRSESSASRRSFDGDPYDDVERDESKRKSRNLSEKKRRDQFNILINELSGMVSATPRKMDKSTVLKATISYLKNHNEISTQSQVQETTENWKPSFLSNEEFTYLMLEALDGFIMVISSSGKVIYVSESVTSLLGHLPSDLVRNPIYDFILPEERATLSNFLIGATVDENKCPIAPKQSNFAIVLNVRLGGLDTSEDSQKYHLVRLSGYMKQWISNDSDDDNEDDDDFEAAAMTKSVFVCTGRLIDSELLRETSVVGDSANLEFSSRHSLEWKFLFLDHRAPPIIGYLPFEVLGTSGYDYYHMDDLEKVASCHEELMQKGEGTSCYYRFLTKGQQWIWLQTRYYITYHQWNSKPEFIVGNHRVVSSANVMKELRAERNTPFNRLNDILLTYSKESRGTSSSVCSAYLSKSGHDASAGYGNIPAKRLPHFRKLDLPPKFLPAISLALPIPADSYTASMGGYANAPAPYPLQQQMPLSAEPQNSEIPLALRPGVASFVQSSAIAPSEIPSTAGVTLPLTNFRFAPVQPSAFALSGPQANPIAGPAIQPAPPAHASGLRISPPQSVIQETLLMKHAELQRHILQQQEELRRVSEQLLMSQCGIIPEPVLIPPTAPALHPPHQPTDDSLLLQQGYQGLLYPQLPADFQNQLPYHQP